MERSGGGKFASAAFELDDEDGSRKKGEAGAVVKDSASGALGGGRWINVSPGSSSVTTAFLDVLRGSLGRGRGRTA